MRVESSVTSVSWIPSEAVTGAVLKGTFEPGVTHYDDPPPDVIDDLEERRAAGRFRFANQLAAWAEIEDGQIVDAGCSRRRASWARPRCAWPSCARRSSRSRSPTSATSPRARDSAVAVRADHRRAHRPPGAASREAPAVRAVQRARRCGPRSRSPSAPTARRTSRCSARASSPGTGSTTTTASSRPRSGSPNFKDWYRDAFGKYTPWGDARLEGARHRGRDRARAPALDHDHARAASAPRSARSRRASARRAGRPGRRLFLVLDGVLSVVIDGEAVAEVGPRRDPRRAAVLEGGIRTATLQAATACGSRWRHPTRSTARRCSSSREHHRAETRS